MKKWIATAKVIHSNAWYRGEIYVNNRLHEKTASVRNKQVALILL